MPQSSVSHHITGQNPGLPGALPAAPSNATNTRASSKAAPPERPYIVFNPAEYYRSFPGLDTPLGQLSSATRDSILERAINALNERGIIKVYGLVTYSRSDLNSIPNFGQKCVDALVRALAYLGPVQHFPKSLVEAGFEKGDAAILKGCGIETVWQLLHITPEQLREIFWPEISGGDVDRANRIIAHVNGPLGITRETTDLDLISVRNSALTAMFAPRR